MQATNPYALESHLVEDFEKYISNSDNIFDINQLAFEFNYVSGKTDIVCKTNNGELIAFEAKLNKWRIALNQAYRNSSFADYSYVILPNVTTKNALKRQHEFRRRGVGLCSVDRAGMSIEIEASIKKPLQPWLKKAALKHIEGIENDGEDSTTI